MATKPSQRLEEKQEQVNGKSEKTSAIPANALRPQDHKSAKADVVDDHHPLFEYDGVEYRVEADAKVIFRDVDFLETLQDNNVVGATRTLLGIEQWMKIKAKYRNPETGQLLLDTEGTGGPIVELFRAALDAAKAKNS